MRCKEVPSLELQDGARRIFLNTRGTDKHEADCELIDLLHYIEMTDEESSEASQSSRIHEIHEHICKIKSSEEIGVRYMQAWEEKALAKEEGKAEGEQESEKRYSRLILKLSEEGKTDQIVKAALNPDFLAQLYRKYHL